MGDWGKVDDIDGSNKVKKSDLTDWFGMIYPLSQRCLDGNQVSILSRRGIALVVTIPIVQKDVCSSQFMIDHLESSKVKLL